MGEKYLSYSKLTEKRYITRKTRNPFTGRITEDLIGERKYVTYAEIDEMPAADVVEVKHGKWLSIPKQHGNMKCSVCGETYGVCGGLMGDYNYCPNCGADMRGKAK